MTSPLCFTTKRSVSVVLPMTAKSRPHLRKIASACFSLAGVEHHEHALLAFRQHHLVGGHARLAAGHLVEVELDAEIALGAHLDRRAGEAGRAHVLDGDDGAGLHQFEAGLQQQLLGEGVADLHGGALLL